MGFSPLNFLVLGNQGRWKNRRVLQNLPLEGRDLAKSFVDFVEWGL